MSWEEGVKRHNTYADDRSGNGRKHRRDDPPTFSLKIRVSFFECDATWNNCFDSDIDYSEYRKVS